MPSIVRDRHTIRIFISAATGEFGPYREELRKFQWLWADIKIQEDFAPSVSPTLEMLDEYICTCDAVIHLAGRSTGAIPHPRDVAGILQKYPALTAAGAPLADVDDATRLRISYTEWEAYLAAHHNLGLLIAQPSGDESESQKAHLLRLKKAEKHPFRFDDVQDLTNKILQSNLRDRTPERALAQIRRDRFGPHAVETLKHILLNETPDFRAERFVFNAYAQLKNSMLVKHEAHDRRTLDELLIDLLSEDDRPHLLLMLALLCRDRARSLSLPPIVDKLDQWLAAVLPATHLHLDAVRGECTAACNYLDANSPPRPYVQINWDENPSDPPERKRVFVKASVCWGRARGALSVGESVPILRDQTVAAVADSVYATSHYQELVYERFELTVPPQDLNHRWEYPPDADPDDIPFPWPVVVRLRRKSWEQASRTTPHSPVHPQHVARLADDRDHFVNSARQSGVFFASWSGADGPDLDTLRRAALGAALGLWLRTAGSTDAADGILSELADKTLDGIPAWYHRRKTDADRASPWRHLSLLYDLPESGPGFAAGRQAGPPDRWQLHRALL